MEFVSPNLPSGRVKKIFVSAIIDNEIQNSLIGLGCEPVFLKPSPNIRSQLRFHPDILTFNVLKGIWLFETGNENMFDFCTMVYIGISLDDKYPKDCMFNMVSAGATLITGKGGYFDDKLFESFDKIIYVKQGYAKCSTIVVDENSFITGDESIYKALKDAKFNVLQVSNEGIYLNGFSNGFIGGCAGKLDKNILAFTGNMKEYTDYKNIKDFCSNLSVEIISLSNKPLYDYGGMLPVTQEG